MRKLLVIPVLFIYLLAISGVVVNAHYCGKNLVSWSMYLQPDSCGGCGDESGNIVVKAKKCCTDKTVAEKVGQDQAPAYVKLKLTGDAHFYLPSLAAYSIPDRVPLQTTTGTRSYFSNAPPGRWQNIPLYKLHARFTYYG